MYEMDQKSICVLIKEGLIDNLDSGTIKINTEYTHIYIRRNRAIDKPDLTERVMQILDKVPCGLYVPRRSEPSRFVAIRFDYFADIEIRQVTRRDYIEYNIYIQVPLSKIQYEWWYDRYLQCR